VLLGIVFIIENLEVLKQAVRLKLDLYVVTFQSPDVYLWVLVLFAFFLGVITTALYGLYDHYQQRQTIRKLRHNLDMLAKELKQASDNAQASSVALEPQIDHSSE
ncbi:MAG: LapA family protein, partial [Deltaproteobacteria bacterium]|nr:LapA family protein [Deltaproteobacteria bacterium]